MTQNQVLVCLLLIIAFALMGALAVMFYPFLGHHWGRAILAPTLVVTAVYGLRLAF